MACACGPPCHHCIAIIRGCSNLGHEVSQGGWEPAPPSLTPQVDWVLSGCEAGGLPRRHPAHRGCLMHSWSEGRSPGLLSPAESRLRSGTGFRAASPAMVLCRDSPPQPPGSRRRGAGLGDAYISVCLGSALPAAPLRQSWWRHSGCKRTLLKILLPYPAGRLSREGRSRDCCCVVAAIVGSQLIEKYFLRGFGYWPASLGWGFWAGLLLLERGESFTDTCLLCPAPLLEFQHPSCVPGIQVPRSVVYPAGRRVLMLLQI